MGFNDWNAFGCNVSASLIEQTALAMHNNGMQAAGYNYVNIDDCWMNGRNVSGSAAKLAAGRVNGHLIADPTFFPPSAPGLNDGIKIVADYVHSLGMKLGIYEDTGTATCQGLAGTYQGPNGATYDTVDAQDFASWGVDYLKDDWCNVPLGDVPGATRDDKAAYLYTQMSQALKATGRPIVFESATLGDTGLKTYTWAPAISNLWRTTSDISASFSSMLRNFTTNSALAAYAGPGHWNDPDMLEIGTGSSTTLAGAVAPGDTNVKVNSVSGAVVGGVLRIGTAAAGDVEGGVITSVGTAAGSTTLLAAAAAGDNNVKVGSVGAFAAGQQITIDTGANAQTATITSVGTAGTSTTLAAATAAGATTIPVASVANLAVGDTLAVDNGANAETVTITAVGTAGATGTGVTVSPALTLAHANRAAVNDASQPGTGVSFAPPLTAAHPAGTTAAGAGTGITISAPLAKSHPIGESAGKSGLTLAESQTEFGLWAMEAAPLIAGTDIVNIAPQNLAVYNNAGVVAIDQDPLGAQATVVTGSSTNPDWTLTKPLANGDTAVALFNAGSTPWTNVSASLASLGLDPTRAYAATDQWSHDTTTVAGAITLDSIPAHGTVLLRLAPGPRVDASASALGRDSAHARLTAPAGDLIVAYVAADSPDRAHGQTTKVTGGGLDWRLAGRANGVHGDAEVWTAKAASDLNNAVINVTGNVRGYNESVTVTAYRASGIGAVTTASSSKGAPTASLKTTAANSWVFASGDDWLASVDRTVGAGQTLVHQATDSVGDTYWVQSTTGPTSASGTRVTINDTAPRKDPYNLVLVEILW
ncbi:hypothetical protein [Rugosimonospora acidiphila]